MFHDGQSFIKGYLPAVKELEDTILINEIFLNLFRDMHKLYLPNLETIKDATHKDRDTYLSGETVYAPSLENVDAVFLANSME